MFEPAGDFDKEQVDRGAADVRAFLASTGGRIFLGQIAAEQARLAATVFGGASANPAKLEHQRVVADAGYSKGLAAAVRVLECVAGRTITGAEI